MGRAIRQQWRKNGERDINLTAKRILIRQIMPAVAKKRQDGKSLLESEIAG